MLRSHAFCVVSKAGEIEACSTVIFGIPSYAARQKRVRERRLKEKEASNAAFVPASSAEECVVEAESAAELADCLETADAVQAVEEAEEQEAPKPGTVRRIVTAPIRLVRRLF